MAIVPVVRCSNLARSVTFYTTVLDFELAEPVDDYSDPGFAALIRQEDVLFLSSHRGDGTFGQAIAVLVREVDSLWSKFISRGLQPPERPSPVHHGPTDQTWGTREFYTDDPDGNTLRFTQEAD